METDLTCATFFGLTSTELTELGRAAWTEKKAEMHVKGVPVTKVVDNKLYHEHPDGRLEWLKDLSKDVSTPSAPAP